MAKLKDRIKTALDEGRMLILGSQVLLGFQFKSILEKGFDKLPELSQNMKLGALGLMIFATALLMSPGTYHRIVDDGEDREDVHRFATGVMTVALLPFAVAIGIDLYVSAERLLGSRAAIVAGLAGMLTALFFWYGLEMIRQGRGTRETGEQETMTKEQEQGEEDGGTKIKDKIDQVLTEARMVLPGAQALLGFQFIAMLMEGFERLPRSSQLVHLASLFLLALTIILLMTPAAYHRLVERGEETEHFHRFASRMLIAAMIPLALGLCAELYIVSRKVTGSDAAALTIALLMLLFFYGLWFGFTFYRRRQHQRAVEGTAKRQQSGYAAP